MAPTLLLLALAHTLVLSLLPLVVLHLPRLVRSASTIQSSIIGASTLCVGLYGACALVALAGSGAEDGRGVAGTLACVGSLFMDIFLILNSCAADRQEQEADSRSRSTGDRLALAGLLSLLVLSALALSVGRAVLHLVFLALVSLLLLRKLFLDGPSFDAEVRDVAVPLKPDRADEPVPVPQRCAHPEQTSTAGAWYAPSRASTRRIAKVFSPLAVLIVAQLFGIALDIMSVIFPVRENYTALDSIGGRSAPTLFGTTSSTTSYVVASCLVLTRWALTLSVAGSTTSPARTLHLEHRSLTPSASVRHLRPHRSPSFNHFDSTFSSWAHPSPLATSRRPGTSSPDRLTAMAYRSPVQQSSASAHLGSSSVKRKAAAHTSFLSLGTTGDTEPSDQDALELDHPYMHSRLQTMPTSTYASSVDEADDEDEHGRSEDLVVPPSPSPFPGGRRTGRISPSLPPSFSQRRTSIAQRAHHSLPPLLTSTPPPSSSRAFPHAQAGNSTADELSSSPTLEQSFGRGRGRRTSSGLSTLPLLARTITRTFSPHGPSPSPSPALAAGPASPYRFPHNRTSSTSRSPDRARAPSHPSTEAPSSKYFSPTSSPRLVRPQPTRSASSSPRKMRRPSLPRLGSVPDARLSSTRSASPAAASALSSSFGGRRRSGSVGSLLRSVAAGRGLGGMSTGASGRSSTTPTPTGDMSFGEVEPNESEDDPFAARSVPPSISSASLRGARSVASLRPSSASGARSTLDVADEAGATKLRRALEAIHEPATEGSREGSARTSRYSAPAPGSDDEGEGLERVLTPAPAPSRASIDESTFGGGSGLYRQASSTGSQFREHLDSPSPSPASSLSGATALHLGLVLPADNALGLETPVVSLPRRRTDQKTSMSPTVLTGRRPSLPLDRSVDVVAEEVQPQLLAFGASARSPPLRDSPSSYPPVQREPPFPTRRGSRIRPSILPVNSSPASLASTPPSSTVRRGSLLSRTKRTTSSPSLLMTSALALRRMRRRSPSPQEESRASESSGLSFACRGPSTSGSDLGSSLLVAHLRPQASAQSSSSEGGNAVEVVDVAGETTVQPGAAPVRRPWWNRLPGSRTGTPYLRSSASSMVPRRTSSSPGLSLARSASLGSSALIVPRSSLGGDSSASSSHMHWRSNSLPLDAMRWSQVQLPPIHDVSPFGSSIFDPRRSGSSDERRRRDPVPLFPASLAAQHALLPLPLDVHLAAGPNARTSFLSIDSSAPSRTSSSLRRISEIRREDVVHQLDDLVGSLGAAFVGPAQASLSGSFEFPERSFASSAGTTPDVVDGEQAQQQSAHEPDVPVSPVTVGSSTPTRSPTSLASSTPLSALFSPLTNVAGDDGEGWARRPSAASDVLRSPLTPASGGLSASRWGSFSDAGGPAAGGEAGWMVWREKSSAASRPDEGAADGEHEETLETLEVDARRG
ncbi:hypothetical protein JCM9279_003721 [Rhodotorula babjevae]